MVRTTWYDHKGNVITPDPPVIYYEEPGKVPRWQLPVAFALGVLMGLVIGWVW